MSHGVQVPSGCGRSARLEQLSASFARRRSPCLDTSLVLPAAAITLQWWTLNSLNITQALHKKLQTFHSFLVTILFAVWIKKVPRAQLICCTYLKCSKLERWFRLVYAIFEPAVWLELKSISSPNKLHSTHWIWNIPKKPSFLNHCTIR